MALEALLFERFRVISRLGEGAYGSVYEAFDAQRDERVAVKVLHRVGADALFRFKQEFRSLKGLRHPNLVELGELIERDGRWMFTMEMVRGSDFLGYVRPRRTKAPPPPARDASARPRLDERHLRDALTQLARGLCVLHRAGKVHRDIKPSNVRVDEEGRVVLLDFGLIKADDDDSSSAVASMVGTAAYMSPEQARSLPVTPASDWYSVGVLLYEALTGRRPFTGSALQILFDKQHQQPASPHVHATGVPQDLESLCMSLLRPDPEARPSGEEVLRQLGAAAPSGIAGPRLFVGREAQLGRLAAAYDELSRGESPRHLYVAGATGVGKSRLLAEWMRRLHARDPETWVLRGRCHEAESVSFRAFDAVIDALCRAMRQLDDTELEACLPDGMAALAEVFPVLSRIDAIARAVSGYEPPQDPWAARSEAFQALRELLASLAAQRTLVIVLDDLHWADEDSLHLLERLLRSPDPPRMLVVASGAPLADCQAPVRQALTTSLRVDEAHVLELGAVALDEATRYAQALLQHERRLWPEPRGPQLARHIAEEAEGHPVFVQFLVRHGPGPRLPTLREALRGRLASFREIERQLLRLIAISVAPLGLRILRRASGLSGSAFTEGVAVLLGSGLVTEERADADALVVITQQRLREVILADLDPPATAAAHRALADAYLSLELGDAETLALHLRAAGDTENAHHFAVIAAGAAADAFAFERAARLFRLAMELSPADDARRRRRLCARYADALAGAGDGRGAAAAYLQAAQDADTLEAAELRTRAAEQLMHCGEMSQALEHIRQLLGALGHGYPRSQARALSSMLFSRARLRLRGFGFEPRGETWVAAQQLAEVDLLWCVSSILTIADMVRGMDLQTRHLICALDAGEPYRLARALALEAQHLQFQEARPLTRATELFAQARLLAEQSSNPHAHAVVSLGEGAAAASTGRFSQALSKLTEAERILSRRCRGGVREIDTAQYLSGVVRMYLGQFGELIRLTAQQLAEAQERGDHYLEALLGMSTGYWTPLLEGETQAARDRLASGASAWRAAGFQSQDILVCVAATYISLCAEPHRAVSEFDAAYARLDAQAVARVPMLRVLITTLRAQALLSSACAQPPSERRASLREVRRLAGRLAREQLGYAPAFGSLVAATLARYEGDSMRAVSLLNEAASGFLAHDMALYAWASRYREGQLIGGDQGRGQVDRALAWLADQGVADPLMLLTAASPGFEPP